MKLRSIQVMRAVAITSVVIYHAFQSVNVLGYAQLGAFGVDLFFVISGFIIATISANRSPGEFLKDRAYRIYPMWWLTLLPFLIIASADPVSWVASLALWPVYHGAFQYPVHAAGWTLSFELMFYLAFALGMATRPIVPLVLYAICAVAGSHFPLLEFLGSPLNLEFIAGTMIARLPRDERLGFPAIALAILWLAVAPLRQFAYPVGELALIRAAMWGAPAALLVYGSLCLERQFRSKAFDGPVFIGNASFSIYLTHSLVMRLQNWEIGIVFSLIYGGAVYWAIERRIMAFGRRSWPHQRIEQKPGLSETTGGAVVPQSTMRTS